MNKKGVVTSSIFSFMVIILIATIFLGVYGLVFYYMNNSLSQNVNVGNVNLNTIRGQTFGQLNDGFLNNLDILGLAVVFGMAIGMLTNAYVFRGKYPKLFIILDIIIMFCGYLVAVYISNTYETLINASSSLTIFSERLSMTSTFILRLPIIVPIIGVIIMILSYSGIPKQEDEIPTLS